MQFNTGQENITAMDQRSHTYLINYCIIVNQQSVQPIYDTTLLQLIILHHIWVFSVTNFFLPNAVNKSYILRLKFPNNKLYLL